MYSVPLRVCIQFFYSIPLFTVYLYIQCTKIRTPTYLVPQSTMYPICTVQHTSVYIVPLCKRTSIYSEQTYTSVRRDPYVRTLYFKVQCTSKYNVPPLTWGVPLSIMYPICTVQHTSVYIVPLCKRTSIYSEQTYTSVRRDPYVRTLYFKVQCTTINVGCTFKYYVPYMYVQYSIPLYTLFLYVCICTVHLICKCMVVVYKVLVLCEVCMYML